MINFQNYLQKLERELKYRNYSPKTIKAYTTCTKYFLEKINKDPENVSRDEIIDFLLFLQSSKKSPKTINLYKEAIRFFYREFLKQKQDIDIKFSHEAKKLPVVLNKSEIISIIESIKNAKHKFIITLSYSAGLRVSDVINLRV